MIWFSTNCRPHRVDPDGWKLHAVEGDPHDPNLKMKDIKYLRSACGIIPRRGWGMDLYIEKKCVQCLRKLGIACKVCKGRGDSGKPNYRPCHACRFTGIEGGSL